MNTIELGFHGKLNQNGIAILNADEIEAINGGWVFLVPIAVAAVGAVAGYVTAKSTDDCTTTTVERTQGGTKVTVSSTVCD